MYADFRHAKPNAAHLRAGASSRNAGGCEAVVTQNIDGLHQDAGSREVVELHGTNRRVICVPAAATTTSLVSTRASTRRDVPICDDCGGPLKAATISFGQSLDPDVLEEAFRLAREADLLLVLGSSLVVQPAAALPVAAAQAAGATW